MSSTVTNQNVGKLGAAVQIASPEVIQELRRLISDFKRNPDIEITVGAMHEDGRGWNVYTGILDDFDEIGKTTFQEITGKMYLYARHMGLVEVNLAAINLVQRSEVPPNPYFLREKRDMEKLSTAFLASVKNVVE